jgi:SSS family transporter
MGFGWIDWTVLALYIVGTSWLADRLAGQKQTIRDYFLGGRRLPWGAVCGSIVASEISGVTFVAIPAAAFAAGGNYTYLMFAIGSVVARLVVGYLLVPHYYREEVYSPYEFMGRRLGPAVDRATTALFLIGAFLAQGSRLFLAALVLDAITGMGIVWAILLIGAISVVWTWIGGITSVVWTDVVQFVVLFLGALTAVAAVVWIVPGGAAEILRLGREAGKFQVFDARFERAAVYTIWTGLLGSTVLTVASHGTDQMMAQRLFCCRDPRDARKAIVWSSVGLLLPALMLTVGVGIYAYFQHVPMSPEHAALVRQRRDYVFPVFILAAMPVGIKGLLFAAIFSAATATSTLAAMAQTALSSFYVPYSKRGSDQPHLLFVSKVFVFLAAAGLCGTAILCRAIEKYPGLLDLALAMAGYTYGSMLGILLLALLPVRRDARGLIWSVPISVLLVFALNWQEHAWARGLVTVGAALLLGLGVAHLAREPLKIAWVLAGLALLLAVAWCPLGVRPDGRAEYLKLAFPWHYPIGAVVTLGLGVVLGRKRLADPERPSVS